MFSDFFIFLNFTYLMEKIYSKTIKFKYGIDAYIGQRIKFENKKEGVIVAFHGAYLVVVFDDDKPTKTSNLHPTWEVEYLGEGNIRKPTRSQRRYANWKDAVSEYGYTFSFKNFLIDKNYSK